MLFHKWQFLIFFVIVYSAYLPLLRTRFWLHWMLIASCVFYAAWEPIYLLLILYSTIVDYVSVLMMSRTGWRKSWLTISLVNNLGILCFFKYAMFLAANWNWTMDAIGSDSQLQIPEILLPMGISFFTFQSMSYTIDYYRGEIKAEPSFVRFATFVSLFPQLVAGPIERASALLPQLQSTPKVRLEDFTDGLSLFVVGLFKKVALANYLAVYVDQVYADPTRGSSLSLCLATFAFAWQIYFDFSGYTDMARGVARAMGFRLMLNFNHPYLASSIRDFWGRWHISLSTWFRDYVYIPLGGSRNGKTRMYLCLIATFLISGFWHGAAWHYVVWGLLHGLAVALMRPVESTEVWKKVPKIAKQLLVFLFVCLTWVYFRAESVAEANTIIAKIFRFTYSDPKFPILMGLLIGSIWIYQFCAENSAARRLLELGPVKVAIVLAMLIYLTIAPGSEAKPFIYFQF